jgi:hypothetical protein
MREWENRSPETPMSPGMLVDSRMIANAFIKRRLNRDLTLVAQFDYCVGSRVNFCTRQFNNSAAKRMLSDGHAIS